MVNYVLKIAADLENLTDLQPQGGCDDRSFMHYLKLKCSGCGEVSPKEISLCLEDTVPLPINKGNCHLVRKCKLCSREGTVTMVTGHGRPLTQTESQCGKFSPVMVFDCRGVEPLDFSFGSGWQAESIEGTKFTDIDLSAGEYADYDEKGECPVMISNLRATFSVLMKRGSNQ